MAGLTFGEKHTLYQGGVFDVPLACRVNLLESFAYVKEWQTERIPVFKRFLLDSGAFTFAFGKGTKGKIDWDAYIDRYAAYIKTNSVEQFLELDIDKLVGYEEVKRLRSVLEEKTGKPCIPVWHLSRGKDEWFRMCDEYERVAIGGIATRDGRKKLDPFLPSLVREAHRRDAKVHGLGYTNLKRLPQIGFDSVDSTSWLWGNKTGAAYYWDGHTMRTIKKKEGQRMKTNETIRHNFLEWVKCAEDMERNMK